MNDGIRYAARPTDSVPKGNFGGMPAEAIAMARQMGMTPEDLKQMDGMWGEMDNLAEADPETYKKFIDDTLKEGPPDKDGKGGGGGGGRGARQFTPVPGFVIKLRTKGDAGAGMTVRTAGGGGDGGQKLFVNVTWHKALEVPKDNFGRPVQRGEKRGADGLQMPLLISKVRPCADHTGQVVASAVDCVFHEWVLIRCEEDNFFKAQVIDLALKWIEDETKFKLNKQWKTIRSSYKGGRGEDGDEPVPFPIDEALMQQDPIEKRKEPEAKSPDAPEIDPVTGIPKPRPGAIPAVSSSKFQTDDLLRSMKNMNQNETQEPLTEIQMPNAGGSAPNRDNGIKGFDVVAPGISGSGGLSKGGDDGGTSKGAASAPRGPLIQDLDELDDAGASNASSGSSENSGATSTTGGAKKKKKGKVVPGGFLNAKKGKAAPRLYGDEGSTETGAKEGSYSRLMSKCKVVDLSSASPEEQKAAMEQHANTPPVRPANPGAPPAASAAPPKPTPTPPPPAPEPTFDAMGKGFLEGNKAGKIYDGKGSTEGGTPMRVDDPLFDSLIAGIDEEYHQAAQPRKDQAEDDVFKQLGEMASVLGGGGDGGGGFDMASMAKMMESLQGPTPGAMPGSAASAPSPGVSSTLPKPSGGNKSPKGAADGGARGGGGGFAPPKYLLNMSKENGEDVAVITVDMAGVTGGMGDVDLEVGGQAVRVVAAGKQPLLVDLPFELNADMTKAKFSKKKGELKVTVRSS
eukprot:CAMPEP_0182562344 /NCGR_PEP_ID=MMETSP1324-20130603/4699_1 /TAXON_ID=236786 /ORGANISM="Florenciella sp., Strain RCC1587" /LENGTH=739 /DNA_ID=CAMNT_0024775273 /DNA_START=82 /DNA_END=2301 /DNA_ORIENTATION=+